MSKEILYRKKNLFSVGILKATDEARSLSQWYGSAVPDEDPYQNVTDPQHWCTTYCTWSRIIRLNGDTRNTHTENSNLFMVDSPYFSDNIYVPFFNPDLLYVLWS